MTDKIKKKKDLDTGTGFVLYPYKKNADSP